MCIRSRVFMALICLAAAAMMAGCGGGGGSDRDGRVAFASGADINVINGNGTDQQMLIANASQASVSRNGEIVVFVRNNNIFALNRKTNVETQLTNTGAGVTVSSPDVDPTGARVVYVSRSTAPGSLPDIREVDVDGNNDHLLVANGDDPVFSRNSARVAFVRDNNIFVIDLATNDVTQVTNTALDQVVSFPAFNESGSHIFFTSQSTAPGSAPSIVSIPTAGGTVTEIVPDASHAVLNPSGDKLVFVRNGRIFRSNRDGTDIMQLTTGPNDSNPSWFD